MALSKLPEIQSRALDLYNNPSERNDLLTNRYLMAGFKQMVIETGNEELAAAYWDHVALMADLSLDELAAVPVGERGDVWYAAAGIITSVSREQAVAESGLLSDSMVKGAEMGDELGRVTKGLSRDALTGATYHIQTELKARKNGGSKG